MQLYSFYVCLLLLSTFSSPVCIPDRLQMERRVYTLLLAMAT